MTITNEAISDLKNALYSEEKTASTISQYIRDITALQKGLGNGELTKAALLEYKARLKEKYSHASVNAAIAAINSFLDHLGKPELKLKTVKVQKQTYADSGRELKKARVEKRKVFPHNFRHLFARLYYSAYKDIVRLADILGHSSINTTRIYTRESGDVHRRQLDKLCLL